MSGGAGNDVIRGNAGNDVISGDAGADLLVGNAGADQFSCDPDDTLVTDASDPAVACA